jgi:hypothetical protein
VDESSDSESEELALETNSGFTTFEDDKLLRFLAAPFPESTTWSVFADFRCFPLDPAAELEATASAFIEDLVPYVLDDITLVTNINRFKKIEKFLKLKIFWKI